MQYLAALDYEHLDNGVFLTSLARSISRQNNVRPILIHGESAYTERIIQTGVMRDEATIRSIKDLNHRLIALLADQGVSTIGINGYQREIISLGNDHLQIDLDYFNRLPARSALLLSTLVMNRATGKPKPIALPRLASFLNKKLDIDGIFIFSASDTDELFTKEKKPSNMRWDELDDDYQNTYIPREFHHYGEPVHLTTARQFDQIPGLEHASTIE